MLYVRVCKECMRDENLYEWGTSKKKRTHIAAHFPVRVELRRTSTETMPRTVGANVPLCVHLFASHFDGSIRVFRLITSTKTIVTDDTLCQAMKCANWKPYILSLKVNKPANETQLETYPHPIFFFINRQSTSVNRNKSSNIQT